MIRLINHKKCSLLSVGLIIILLVLFFGPIFCFPAFAQIVPGKLSLTNRFITSMETQTRDRVLNNWLDLDYKFHSWWTGLRFEFHDPRNPQRYHDRVTQRYMEYRHDWLKIRAGNFYERLGRGLVFHVFEIQSQAIDRTEQNLAIDRNIDGLNIKISLDKLEFTGIWGRPLKMLSSEREDPLAGTEVQFHLNSSLMFGASLLRLNTENFRGQEYHVDMHAAELGLNLNAIDVYVEFAQKNSSLKSAEPNGKALYASATFTSTWFGMSAEYKRYQDFSSVFNNPPALVKTHSFVLLNRHTHTLNANDEMGYQIESYFSPSPASTITLHASGADNLENNPRRRFREYFIESQNTWSERLITRLLLDYNKDRPVGDLNR